MKGGMNMHNNLDPEEIEDLLRNVPKIEDTRTKEDVFARSRRFSVLGITPEPTITAE